MMLFSDWHWRGYGASESITRLVSRSLSDTSRGANLQELRITISRSHLNQKVNESLIRAFSPQKIQILAAGGSAFGAFNLLSKRYRRFDSLFPCGRFKLLSLLEGKADLYVHPSGSNKWDLCASCALIDAVHGRATGLDGSILDFSAHGPVRIPDTTGFFAAVSDQLYSRWQKVAVASFIPNNP
ncbi:unnamed protein product [Protopolystoma xenopodis]|uniref:3'(2'),5'-bisphosphate nucleotidase 1 n=1 Tax=Protopolystoma xenopodis TaxID=117903 RepID=A0A3S4ZR37_9PLAT|nr:unnamed protein product [Protopolystoma xenopodis]